MADMLSGMTVRNTPPKKAHAASQPSMTAWVVWVKLTHTKQCRLTQAVKIRAWAARVRSVTGSWSEPMRPKSIWHSSPGRPSATRTVGPRPRRWPRTSRA